MQSYPSRLFYETLDTHIISDDLKKVWTSHNSFCSNIGHTKYLPNLEIEDFPLADECPKQLIYKSVMS